MQVDTGAFRQLIEDVAAIKAHLGARDELVARMADKLVAALGAGVPGDVSGGISARPARRRARTGGRPRGHLRSIAGGRP
jgi:hypothetical protein